MKISEEIKQKIKVVTIIALIICTIWLLIIPQEKKQTHELADTSMDRHTQNTVNFFSEVIGSHQYTEVFFPFAFENDSIDLWIGFKAEDGNISKKEYLVFHPALYQIDWPRAVSGELVLYQKEKQYDSVEDFLQKPEGMTFADPNITLKYEELNFLPIESNSNLQGADFILTTYKPIDRGSDGTYYFKQVFDTSNAAIDDQNSIAWGIYAAKASEESAYFRGQIDITFIQK